MVDRDISHVFDQHIAKVYSFDMRSQNQGRRLPSAEQEHRDSS